jgi:hypothetical protein
MLPPKLPKKERRTSRFRSQRHLKHVRSHSCAMCFGTAGIQAAHVRMRSGAGMGEKPDDWRTVPLCSSCHNGDQHTKMGEPDFWQFYAITHNQSVWQLIDALCATSPVGREIEAHRNG